MSNFKPRIAVLDYGMGNLHSVAKAVEHVAPDAKVVVTSDSQQVSRADHIIFPGVGAIRDCMKEIKKVGLDDTVRDALHDKKPVLGICIGMQALMNFSSENGGTPCIGVLPGESNFFGKLTDEQGNKLKVPHMGWNEVSQTVDHPLWQGIPDNSRFYFVHSYYVEPTDPDLVAGRCHYGLDFTAAVAKKNLFAVQFHPEKSHTVGLQLLRNFVNWDGTL